MGRIVRPDVKHGTLLRRGALFAVTLRKLEAPCALRVYCLQFDRTIECFSIKRDDRESRTRLRLSRKPKKSDFGRRRGIQSKEI